MPIFHTVSLCINLHDPLESLRIFVHNFNTVRVSELLGGAKILPKSLSLFLGCSSVTDDRQTDDRWHAI